MTALWPLMQEELARLLPQLRRFVDAMGHGEDAAAAAQWQRRLTAFKGATRVLGETALPNVVERMEVLWQSPGSHDERLAQARRCIDTLATIAGQDFTQALETLAGMAIATVPAAAPAASAPALDARLRGLFATEVDDKCNAIERVLLQLEQAPERLELIAPLMRAAHSIKGAARAA
ncbi:MAG: Hpt domain-containing protein, partial [Arenimonas sp.]|uniref:Hpt domain-containing protein n=1 Tax=Arenimonas sp. TaxID=1872635 RepID=UPI0025BD4BDA